MEQKTLEKEFSLLIEAYQRIIWKVCYVYAPKGMLEDYYQEVLLALWRGYPKFRGESKVSTWVYRVSLYACISCRRRQPSLSAGLSLDVCVVPVDTTEEKEQIGQLYEIINRLGSLERALILLWLEEKTYDEMAEITGLTRQNVAVKLTRIREKLRKMYNR